VYIAVKIDFFVNFGKKHELFYNWLKKEEHVWKTIRLAMTKKLNKNDLIVAYNNKLVTTLEELQAESSQVSSEDKVELRALFIDPNTGLRTPKKMEIKGGKLELEAEP